MGQEKKSGTTVVNQTTTPKPTVEETALNSLEVKRQEALYQPSLNLQKQAMNLSSLLLGGGQNLPGFFGDITGGISSPQMQSPGNIDASKYQVGEGDINSIVQNSLRDLYPQFQQQGILDSGTAAAVAGRSAADVRRNVLERNLDVGMNIDQANKAQNLGIQEYNIGQQASNQGFNISNLFNLLNLATGSSAQVQQPQIQQAGLLSQRLAGLRSTNTRGTSTETQIAPNPFISSFQTSLGNGLGSLPGKFIGFKGGF